MFQVSDAAIALMAGELDKRNTPARVIRFYHNTQGLHLRLSEVGPGDKSFGQGGRTVFVVDDDLAQRLNGQRLDLKHTVDGTKLALCQLESTRNRTFES